MRGFCTEALVILPDCEKMEARDEFYFADVKKAANNLKAYLESFDIDVDCLASDLVAREVYGDTVDYIASDTPEDFRFMQTFCEGYADKSEGHELRNQKEIFDLARKKYPVKRGMKPEERLPIVVKRQKFIVQGLLKNHYKLVVTFEGKYDARFKVESKENDGKLIIRVSGANFICTTEMSGNRINPVTLLGQYESMTPLTRWR